MKRIKVTAKISVLFISDSWDILDVHEDGTVEKVTDSFFVEVYFLLFLIQKKIFFKFDYRQIQISSVKRQMM